MNEVPGGSLVKTTQRRKLTIGIGPETRFTGTINEITLEVR